MVIPLDVGLFKRTPPCGGLMVGMDSVSSGALSAGIIWAMFFGKAIYCHGASSHPGVYTNFVKELFYIQGEGRE